MRALFSFVYWTYFAITAMILYFGALVIRVVTAPFDPTGRLLHRYTCWWGRLYLRCLPGCRVKVEGQDKIAPNTPYVLVANHQSLTDVMALSYLKVMYKWVSKKENFRIPFIGWNAYLNRCVRVDRGNLRDVARTMAECRNWLKQGVSLFIFPEGHRSSTGEMIKFHSGAFKLAADCGCAVVPIVVDGTLPIYRGLRVMAFPGQVTVRVLDPLTVADAGGSALKLRDLVFERMQEALADIRARKIGAGNQAPELTPTGKHG